MGQVCCCVSRRTGYVFCHLTSVSPGYARPPTVIVVLRVSCGNLEAEHRTGRHGLFLRFADSELGVMFIRQRPFFCLAAHIMGSVKVI